MTILNAVNGTARKLAWAVPALLLAGWLGVPFTYVGTNSTGVVTTFGAVTGTLDNGPHLKLPFQEVIGMETKLISVSMQTRAPTKDLQEVTATATFQFSLVPGASGDIYETVGDVDAVKAVILSPGLQDVLKAVTAQYSLADLLEKRDPASMQTRDALEIWVKESLKARGLGNVVKVGTLQLANFDYSKVFAAAVANKSEVAQNVPKAENNRDATISAAEGEAAKIRRDAKAKAQKIRLEAEAEAKGMRDKSAQLIAHPDLPCYLLQKKWDGQLPAVQGGTSFLPFYDQACGKK